jgi:NADPH-dependent 2,4-dienoyl-CoA reductase/sulfur reductase-like enzyme
MSVCSEVIIAGGSLSGVTAAESLRNSGFAGRIQIFSDEKSLPYNRPPLSKQVLLGKWSGSECFFSTEERFKNLDIEFYSGKKVDSISVDLKEIYIDEIKYEYQNLIIATGVRARQLPKTEQMRRVFNLRTLNDVLAIKEILSKVTRIGVIGSGVLGCEIASAISSLGKQVTILDQIDLPTLPMTGGHISVKIQELFLKNKIQMLMNRQVKEISEDSSQITIVLNDGSELKVELVIVAIGSIANTEWLSGSGLDISNGVLCDSKGEAGDGIFAVGDVARWWSKSTNSALKRENQSSAIEQGVAVGNFIATGEESDMALPFFWSEIFGTKITITGALEPDQNLEILHGDFLGDSFVGATFKDSIITGILGWNMPKEFREVRKKLEENKNG